MVNDFETASAHPVGDFGDFGTIDFDEAYGDVDVNADLSDQPPPPEDGHYKAHVFITAPEKSDIRGGREFAGVAIRPKYTGSTLKTDDKGRVNGTLYTTVKVMDQATGKILASCKEYVFTHIGNNGTSPALSLAKGMGIDVASPAAIGEFVKAHIQSGKADSALLNYGRGAAISNLLLLDGLKTLIEAAGTEGFTLPSIQVQTVLEAPNGKVDASGFKETDVKIRGSKRLADEGHWPRPDETKIPGARLATNVVSFAARD